MDGMKKTDGLGMPCDPDRKRDDNALTLSAIRTAYGSLGMVKVKQERMPQTNARLQLIAEISAVLDKLETSHELAKAVCSERDAA